MITLILVNLVWIIYSMIEGFREGFYFFFRTSSNIRNNFEIHPYFSAQRGIVLLLLTYISFSVISYWSLTTLLSMMLIFSYFHNGTYYHTRNKLDSKTYPLKWMDQSTTSTAKMTKIMTYRNRSIFAAIGFIIQIVLYILIN